MEASEKILGMQEQLNSNEADFSFYFQKLQGNQVLEKLIINENLSESLFGKLKDF